MYRPKPVELHNIKNYSFNSLFMRTDMDGMCPVKYTAAPVSEVTLKDMGEMDLY